MSSSSIGSDLIRTDSIGVAVALSTNDWIQSSWFSILRSSISFFTFSISIAELNSGSVSFSVFTLTRMGIVSGSVGLSVNIRGSWGILLEAVGSVLSLLGINSGVRLEATMLVIPISSSSEIEVEICLNRRRVRPVVGRMPSGALSPFLCVGDSCCTGAATSLVWISCLWVTFFGAGKDFLAFPSFFWVLESEFFEASSSCSFDVEEPIIVILQETIGYKLKTIKTTAMVIFKF